VTDLRRHAPLKIGGTRARSTLLFFLSPTCPVCKKLLPVVKSIAQAEAPWLDVVLTSDGEPAEHERFIRAQHLEAFPYVLSADIGMTYRIGKLPYAVMIDEEGVIRAKGLINTREHLESLIEAKQMGVPSIQQYIKTAMEDAGHEAEAAPGAEAQPLAAAGERGGE
jgi:methylamine dehydrogenase accessory protein MauD